VELHLVGGFLGSGKSTAILHAARLLSEQGQRVGIITNEQGKHLVDTGLLQSENLPALEVTGGCFCCHLDDFSQRLEEITNRFDPHVIFAESVGSCTDLVATVIKPLLEWQATAAMPSSLSVFADSRLLLRYLEGQELPFSEGIIYIFEKQIEETNILVINKIDLLTQEQRQRVVSLAEDRFPHKTVRSQNSLDSLQVQDWLALIRSSANHLPTTSLDLDYDRYAGGEGRFFWLDRTLRICLNEKSQTDHLKKFLQHLANNLFGSELRVAHLKCLLNDESQTIKINLTSMDSPAAEWASQLQRLDTLKGTRIHLLINIMLEGNQQLAEQMLEDDIDRFLVQLGLNVETISTFSRVPGYPKPTIRISNNN